MSALVPGRYTASSGRTYAVRDDARFEPGLTVHLTIHLVYSTSGRVSQLVLARLAPDAGMVIRARGVVGIDLAEIAGDPAAAAVRAGRCPHCQTPAGPGFDPDGCRSEKHAGMAS